MNDKRISYQDREVFVGFDVHKQSYAVSVVCGGLVVKSSSIPAEPQKAVAFIKNHFPGAKVKSCYEAGFSGFGLHRELESAGIENIVIHAAAVEVSSRDRVKTDKRDSKKLATQLSAGRLQGIFVPSAEQESARLLHRTRAQIVKETTRVRNQIRMKLHQFGELEASDDSVLSITKVQMQLQKPLSQELDFVIRIQLSVWEELLRRRRILEKEISRQAKSDPLEELWRSVPGVGAISARVLATELGDMSQFRNERALFSFTGLTPSEYSSGGKIYRGHISRQGSGHLRLILTELAWRAIRKDKALREDFERIGARRGKKRAIVAIARKLVGRARAAFMQGERYKLEHYKTA